ncbi:winged helix DNA-binding domain-containing protein [Isoptericola sp. NEAU-Y5]|uniref:Winged helix DNA-binding domain-containing protein n=1 Tax=Isoptericola luteus TaxID=2879484 RepID=A0ABS7ZDB1_9MICO|nr:winged helix DNA-binding domain-containing protein [Isoptericola sp. NEAU-Y5]MCA5893026.1 winged helix DNA-binding domain-containing protein [Isoptericola sp. NEAU-Y5]
MRITGEQRRRRLVAHQLALGVDLPGRRAAVSPEDVTDRLVALHATDAPSVHLAVLARVPGLTVDDVRAALFERRSLVKVLGMRRTMFVVPRSVVPVVHAGASLTVAARLRTRLLKELATLPTDPPVADPGALLEAAQAQVRAVLAEHGPLDGAELARAAPLLRTAFLPTTDKVWDVRRTLTSPLLSLLSAQGDVVRGEPRGAWSSPRHVWSLMSDWFPDGIPVLDEDAARTELARSWLAAFGPATVADLKWWTGWNLGQTRRALADLDLREVEVDVGPLGGDAVVVDGVMLRGPEGDGGLEGLDDPAVDAVVEQHVALLPTLDPTVMGWTARDWYLGPHRPLLFDSAGNAGATVWWQGRVVGAWTALPDGEVVWRILEDVGTDARAAVAAEAARLTGLLGGVGFTPGYVTPLYRELRATG